MSIPNNLHINIKSHFNTLKGYRVRHFAKKTKTCLESARCYCRMKNISKCDIDRLIWVRFKNLDKEM